MHKHIGSPKLSILNTINKIQDNEPFVFVNKQLKDTLGKNSQVFNTETPFIVDKVQAQKKEYLNECIESLGINTTNTNKKERMLSDEVNSNNQFVNFNLDIFKNTREEFKKINKYHKRICLQSKNIFRFFNDLGYRFNQM